MNISKRSLCLWDAAVESAAAPVFKMSKMTPFELSRVVFRAIREQRSDVPFWKAVIARAKQIDSQLSPSDISVIVYGLGKMKYRDRDLLAKLATAVTPNLSSMSLSDISHLLSGYARVQVRNDLLFDLASREIGKKLATAQSLADVTNICCAYTALNYEHQLLFAALSKRAMLLLPSGTTSNNPRDLAMLVDSFSRISTVESSRLFALASSEICRKIDSFPAFSLALVASSYARAGLLRNQNQFLLEQVLDESFKRRHEFDSGSVATLLNAISKAPKSSKSQLLFDFFVSDLSKKGVQKFDLHSVTLLAGAMGKHFKIPEGSSSAPREISVLFHQIGDRVASLAGELKPRQIAMLANAFSAVGVRHGPLLYNLPQHVKETASELSLVELSMILKAYACLAIRNDSLLEVAPGRILELISSGFSTEEAKSDDSAIYALTVRENGPISSQADSKSTSRALLDILESYAMLMVGDSALLKPVVNALCLRKDSLSDNDLLVILPRCLNVLMLPCPHELAQLIIDKTGENTLELSPEIQEELHQFTQQYKTAIDK